MIRDERGPANSAARGTLNWIPSERQVSVKHIPPVPGFVPWAAARFQTEEARDRFLSVVATRPTNEVEGEPVPDEGRCARVRWRPGHFLGLNDVAYTHGGRIMVAALGRNHR
jgi:hypothetical protein